MKVPSSLGCTQKIILFSLFNMTHLVTQESVKLSDCCFIDNMNVGLKWPTIKAFQENSLFQSKLLFGMHNEDT